jgi:protein required for attachment to host cells
LVLVAPPQAVGDLRSRFSEDLKRMVTAELNKDLTKIPIHELPDFLGEVMAI